MKKILCEEGVHVPSVTFQVRHKDALHVVLEPRVSVESVRDNVAVTPWTTVTTGWDKHAGKMRMRKTCARTIGFYRLNVMFHQLSRRLERYNLHTRSIGRWVPRVLLLLSLAPPSFRVFLCCAAG